MSIASSRWFFPVAIAVASCGLVALVRHYAIRRALLDHPNWRSSHAVPTPHGGGLGMIAALFPFWLWSLGDRASAFWPPVVGVVVLVAVGWRDDHSPMGVRPRLAAHLAAAICLLPLALRPTPVPAWMGWMAGVWWVFWCVSAVNVVNFMDGIDGLIGSQMLVFGMHLAWSGIPSAPAASFGIAIAAASAGFLVWNWSPARVFMGDVGSGTLGFSAVLGGLLLLREGSVGLVLAFLPLFPLFLDATVTLLRRARKGERVTEPHRQHLYQRLANEGWGHQRVTVLYALAASVGVVVARSGGSWRSAPVLLYGISVAAAGWILDRRVPIRALLGTPAQG